MARKKVSTEVTASTISSDLWELGIEEVTGHSLEAQVRDEVNALLKSGWVLLLVYTLKYREDGIWRERPMAILGKSKTDLVKK